jgi:outer membrane lipopolysaccharide assembly protein LptE/RlpB
MKSVHKILIAAIALLTSSCGIYNFRGANIPDDVKTFSVGFFSNEASYVNPSLSVDLTEKLKTKFQTETTLNLKSEDGDYQMSGVIKRYEITPAALNAQTGAAQTQFSITITVDFTCPKYPEKDFSRDFTSSTTFDASTEFSSVESSLSQELTEIIVQQIFAAIALDW